ncbi:DNA-binding domain-containing protein [Shewanella sp. 10N.7]|uniref:HvfC/BufC N-terminal domain-containing protein n=1 Tax=Shewanella sp. 10N.7 TaxID=2885093 RepID=UPI001E378C2A|nr:DNA-binding domain-containing protein [Shewanella sp. 10N.7]MCC4832292.1 DNA-binding domain-containing protein [Shewanella sp. 10N.7]
MSQLRQTQQAFMQYLLSAKSDNNLVDIRERVSDQKGISADHRLQIYANAYRIRLKETMEMDHQILGQYLGDELFDKLAIEYLDAHPSSATSLRQFCDNLPAFLRTDDFFCQYPILADIAQFERLLLAAFDGAESTRADFTALQTLAPELWPDCSLRFHPSLQMFSCTSNAVESWQALKAETAPDAPYYQQQRYWALWRNSERLTQFESLNQSQYALLTGFIEGNDFAHQCEAMLNWYDEQAAPMMVLQTLQSWFSKGIIRELVIT